MDGHGVFVWSAYAITLVMLTLILVLPIRRRRRLLVVLGDQQRREAAERSHTDSEGAVNSQEGPH